MDSEDSPWSDLPSQPAAAVPQETGESTRKDEPAPTGHPVSSIINKPMANTSHSHRAPRRVEAQPRRLDAVDDSLDPLGPLGDTVPVQTEPAPVTPFKEHAQSPRTSTPLSTTSNSRDNRGSIPVHRVDDDALRSSRARHAPPVQPHPTGIENSRMQKQPSVSIEQAAKPTFDITVGDPHKVGDLTSSHIVYQVRTKTTSKAYKQPEFTVSRRYKDFLWLYDSLHDNNLGVVVPPPPEKQAVGRFDSDFVESRRSALERMLNKTAAHPILQHDSDLKIFLESDAFNIDVKQREVKDLGFNENKGMFSSIGFGSSGSGKFVEYDDWFQDRKIYLDAMENQLKALLKAIENVVLQRKALAEATHEFSASLHALSTVELAPTLSWSLEGLSDLQLRIRELYERQAQQDVLTMGITVDEYIRLIASVKTAFGQRQKAFHTWHTAEAELQKRKSVQEKVLRQGKTQQDRLNQLQADSADGERRCHQARLQFEDMGRLMRGELERFEKEKVEDFKSGVETYLEGAVETQKELIEIWETYLLQLDADADDVPFFNISSVPTDPLNSRPRVSQTESSIKNGKEPSPVAPPTADGET